MPETQSAYHQYHSTETVVTKVYNDLLLAADQGDVSALCLLDLTSTQCRPPVLQLVSVRQDIPSCHQKQHSSCSLKPSCHSLVPRHYVTATQITLPVAIALTRSSFSGSSDPATF